MLMRKPDMPKGHVVTLDGTQYDVENGFVEVPEGAPREHVEQIAAHGFELAQSPAARGAAPQAQEPTQESAPEPEPGPEPEPPRKRGEVFVVEEPIPEPEETVEPAQEDLPADVGQRCLGMKKDGTRCSLPPTHGERYCHLHASQADE